MIEPRPLLVAAAFSAALFFTTAVSAYDNADDCILEKTYECLDADDFWGCYDFIVEGCTDQVYEIAVPPGQLKKLKAAAQRRAGLMYKRHLASTR
jgi:hypothetical protein